MKFFFDENISYRIVEALRCLENHNRPDVADEHKLDHTIHKYPGHQGPVLDTEFIPEMTAEGYIIITADHSQKKNRGKHAAESQAYRDSGAIAFWVPKTYANPRKKSDEPGKEYKFEQAAMLFRWWPAIKRAAGSANPRDLFDIDDRGRITRRV
uniref:VapC45 PIN like domain-containing protein n=1 Tax=mine drainage metagenome TaxID=410659 RepID=E6Q7N7_9ZZZZ